MTIFPHIATKMLKMHPFVMFIPKRKIPFYSQIKITLLKFECMMNIFQKASKFSDLQTNYADQKCC